MIYVFTVKLSLSILNGVVQHGKWSGSLHDNVQARVSNIAFEMRQHLTTEN